MKQAITIHYAGGKENITFTGPTACLQAYRWLGQHMIVGSVCKFNHNQRGSITFSKLKEIARMEKSENE